MRAAAETLGDVSFQELDVDWTLQLLVPPDRLSCHLRVELRGAGKDCPPERTLAFLRSCRVQLSPSEERQVAGLMETVRGGTPKPVLIAVGQAPQPATRSIRWHVSLDSKRADELRTGAAIDTHQVSNFVSAAAGQTLCEVLATQAVEGRDVFGGLLPCPAAAAGGADPLLTPGEGASFADDGQTVVATCDGCVQWKAGVLSVTRVLEVKGNVDYKIGNIDFNGDVSIQGDVLPGFQIKAAGTVKIGGMVERASIEARDQITVRGGVAGRHQATLKAGGSIEARYLHMLTVESGDNVVIHTECLETDVTAARDVLVERGAIIGGVVRARGNVRAAVVGSEMGVATVLIAGKDSQVQHELDEAKRTLERLHERILNDEHAIGLFANLRGGIENLSAPKRQMVTVLQEQLSERQRAFDAQRQRVNELLACYAERIGTVTITQKVFANVTVRIGEYSRTVNTMQTGPLVFYPDVEKGTLEVRSK